MPRPKDGYKNAAGQPIPGTHDPISRYMDRSALMIWAHKRGEQGLPLWGRDAIDIGRTVHAMADLDLQSRPDKDIEKVVCDAGLCRNDHDKAMRSFMQFRKWRMNCHLQPIALETSLVSEAHQYGGTPDCIAVIGDKVSLVEFKTSVKPYPDHLVAMAAHAQLWNENHADQPIEAFHWIGLPKDGSEFQHHAYADLSAQWEIFTGYLDLWRIEKGITRKRTVKPATVVPAPKTRLATPAMATSVPSCGEPVVGKPKAAAKPRCARKSRVMTATAPPVIALPPLLSPPPLQSFGSMAMAELLRRNGLLREVA